MGRSASRPARVLIGLLLFSVLLTLQAIPPVSSATPRSRSSGSPPLPYGPSAPVGQYNGTGDPISLLAAYNKTIGTKTETNDSHDLTITVAQNWNTIANLSFTEITPQRVVLNIETNESADEDGHIIPAAMSFHITNSCRLYSVMVKVKAAIGELDTADDLSIRIYNATDDGSGKPKPYNRATPTSDYVYFDIGDDTDAFDGWLNATWSSTIILNATKTFQSYFFVVLSPESGASPRWKLRSDAATGDNGYAWRGPTWNLMVVDYFLNVSLRPMGLTSAPTQIAMKVNGTAVANATGNAGWWNGVFTPAGSSAFFNVSATWPIRFNYTYIARFSRTFSGGTYFLVNHGLSSAGWNITTAVSYPNVGANPDSRILDFTIPPYWIVVGLYNGSTLIPPANYTWSGAGAGASHLFIDEPHGAGNGTTWRVVSTDSNYVNQVLISRGGSSVAGLEANITDTLQVSASLLQFYYTDGSGNFTLYDRDNTSLTMWTKTPAIYWLNFSAFSPAVYTVKNGRLTCEVVWGDGWHVGVKSNYVWLVYTTESLPEAAIQEAYSGDLVTLRVYYNDTFNGQAVVEAQVNVTVGSDGPHLMSNQGDGWYEYSWNSAGKPNADYILCYSAKKSGYSQAVAYATLKLYSRTQLDPSWITQTIHYNHSIELRVNYTILTGGTGGIAGATVNITFGATTYELVDLGNGTYRVLLNGTDLDLGVHSFTVRVEKTRYEAQQDAGTLTVDEEPTQISGNVAISIEVGTSFNITVVYTAQEGGPISGATFECRRNGTLYSSFVVHYLAAGTYNLTFTFAPASPTYYEMNITASRYGFEAKSHFCDVLVYFPGAATADPGSVICLIGDNMTIGAWYNETYSGGGIAGAIVNVTFGGTTYQLYNQGSGYYARALNSSLLGLTRGIQVGTVRASRYGYLSAITSVTLTLWSKTQLVANWTVWTINYTESVVLMVNYSVVTPLGEGGITGSLVNITEPSFFAWLTEAGAGNYSILLNGTDLGVGNHLFVVNASKTGYYVAQTLLIVLVVQGEPTELTGEAPPSVEGGTAFTVNITYRTQGGEGIDAASFTCLLNGAPFVFFVRYELGGGEYRLEFVLNVTGAPATFNITLTAFRAGYWPQTFKTLVLVTLRSTSYQVIVLSAAPVVYAGDFVLRVNFTDGVGQGLAAALVTGNWSAIIQTDHLNGTYTIRCLTTGAAARYWSVNLTLILENYEVQWFVKSFYLVWPTTLTPTQGIYSVFEYENETLIVETTYTDTHAGAGIENGTLWAVFQGSSYALTSMGGGVYRLSLNLTGVTPLNYILDIFAQGEPYQQQSLQLNLRVLAKLPVNLSVMLPPVLFEGTQIPVTIQLAFLNGTPIAGAKVSVTVWVHHANGTDVTLTSQNVTTDVLGQAIFVVLLPSYPPAVWTNGQPAEMWVLASYGGSRAMTAASTQASRRVSQSSLLSLLLALLLRLLPFIVLIIIVIAIGWAYYAKKVKPGRAKRLKTVESRGGAWAQRMLGLLDLRALFVMHASTGLPIFTYSFTGGELPSALLSGFISAVSAFHGELSGKPDRASQLRDIHYKDLHLSLNEGRHVISVAILDASPSEEVTQSLADFTRRFEQTYTSDLSGFDGRIDVFEGADELVGKSFHSDLLVAHKCDKQPSRGFPQRVYALAKQLARTDGHVYLPQLFVAAVEKFGPGKKFAIAHAIEKLRGDGCLVPSTPQPAKTPSSAPENPSAQA